MRDADLDQRLEPLYREPPDEFVRGRDALAKELREQGDRETATAVKKLRRPSQSAWLINRVAIEDPDRARRLADAAGELVDAQQRMLEGRGDAADLRAAAERERERVERMVEAVRRVAAEHSKPVSAAVIERVGQTLQAVGSDPELRDRLVRGRVERDHRAATIGLPDAASLAAAPKPRKRAESRKVARARGELARLRDELADSARRRDAQRRAVDEAEAEARRLKLELGKSEAEARELERRIAAAERELDQ
jgi:chromosome segregation ATPase